MIPTRHILFDGVMLEVPLIGGSVMEFLAPTLKDYPSHCGAGHGIGDKIVPEYIYEAKMSCPCHSHDVSWAVADGSMEEFQQSNRIFRDNMIRVLDHMEKDRRDHAAGMHLVAFYYGAVEVDIGWAIYKRMHKQHRLV